MLFNTFTLLAAFLQVGICSAAAVHRRDVNGPLVTLDYARFEGISTNGVDKFLGIPYAQPPVGDLRFRRPQPPLKSPGNRLVSVNLLLRRLFGGMQRLTSLVSAGFLSGHHLWVRLPTTKLHPASHSGPQLLRAGHIRLESKRVRRLYVSFLTDV
jgi:hypothetical protein